MSDQNEWAQIETLRDQLKRAQGERDEVVEKIGTIYQITGIVLGGNEIESARKLKAALSTAEQQRDDAVGLLRDARYVIVNSDCRIAEEKRQGRVLDRIDDILTTVEPEPTTNALPIDLPISNPEEVPESRGRPCAVCGQLNRKHHHDCPYHEMYDALDGLTLDSAPPPCGTCGGSREVRCGYVGLIPQFEPCPTCSAPPPALKEPE